MTKDIFEREIHTAAELQEVLISEGYSNVKVDEYTLIPKPHTHPTTGEEFNLWSANAQVAVTKDGVSKIWTVEKNDHYITVADVSNAVVAYIETICCRN